MYAISIVNGHAGGEAEAWAAYEDAMATLADEAADCHSHMQSHTSKRGNTKWTMMEMWPMLVPLPALPTFPACMH